MLSGSYKFLNVIVMNALDLRGSHSSPFLTMFHVSFFYCLATCSALGFTNFQTFDGKQFEVYPKECGYTLLRDCRATSLSSKFSIKVQNEECQDVADMQYCKKQIIYVKYSSKTLEFQRTLSGSSVQIQVMFDGQKITDYLEENGLRVDFVGLHSTQLSSDDFDLILTGKDLYVMAKDLQPGSDGVAKTCGLCGTYNHNSNDDFKGPNNALSSSADTFLRSWHHSKDQGSCDGTLGDEEPTVLVDYCSLYWQNLDQSQTRARFLKKEDGPFKDCLLSPELYYSRAMKTGCRHRESLCDVISGFAKACGDAGYSVGDWRTQISGCIKR